MIRITKTKIKEFFKDYQKLCKKHGIVIEINNFEGVYLTDYNGHNGLYKKWLEAMQNNKNIDLNKKKDVMK